jgi:hypothetical protein
MYFGVSHIAIRMGMFEFGGEWMNAVKSAEFGSATRRNRFPVGRNRVPLWKICKNLKNTLRNRFRYMSEPGSHTFFQKREFLNSGTGLYIGRNRVLQQLFEKYQTLKIHNFQTVSPFWAPFWTLFLKFNALFYKMKRFSKTWNYFENESNSELGDYRLTHVGVYVAVRLWWMDVFVLWGGKACLCC